MSIDGIDARRIEEAGLNALSTQRQLFYDGWLLRLSPGKARRARSVNPHFGSTLPLGDKLDYCERVYAAHELPVLYRITPFAQPHGLDEALGSRGYAAFDTTLVQAATLERPPEVAHDRSLRIAQASAEAWVDAVGALRGSTPLQRAAHLERIANTPLEARLFLARRDGEPLCAGQFTLEDGLAGLYDIVTAEAQRGRGIATALCAMLLAKAWERGARAAYLQVNADNAPALAIYRKLGFATLYTYHYRGPDANA